VIVSTDKFVGGSNIVVATILSDLTDSIGILFMAITHISYCIPLCRLSIVYVFWVCVNSLETVSPITGLANTVYLFTFPADAVKEMVIDKSVLALKLTSVGGNNNVLYTIEVDAAEMIPSIIAKIFIVYNTPGSNPVIVYSVTGSLSPLSALNGCGVIDPLGEVAVIS
jgi:hypothetical protein